MLHPSKKGIGSVLPHCPLPTWVSHFLCPALSQEKPAHITSLSWPLALLDFDVWEMPATSESKGLRSSLAESHGSLGPFFKVLASVTWLL